MKLKQTLKFLSIIPVSVSLMYGCVSKNEVKNIDNKLELKGKIGNLSVGLNKDRELILQESKKADSELTDIMFDNNRLESDIRYAYHEIKRCRRDRSDPRLGGNGEVVSLPKTDFDEATSSSEELGLNEKGELLVIKRSLFEDRLKNEQDKNQNLKSLLAKVKEIQEDCEVKMGHARVRAGLPAARYQGRIEVHSDGTVKKTINAHEKNLDDAFRILEMKQKMETKESDRSRLSDN